MKPLSLMVHEPGDTLTTADTEGNLRFWIVQEDGGLAKPDPQQGPRVVGAGSQYQPLGASLGQPTHSAL